MIFEEDEKSISDDYSIEDTQRGLSFESEEEYMEYQYSSQYDMFDAYCVPYGEL